MNQTIVAPYIAHQIRDRGMISASRLSARSGVSRSTMHRVDSGEGDLALRTLRELAIAAGLDLDLNLVPLSDPDAATAARRLLGDPSLSDEVDDGVLAWEQRLPRLAGGSDP